MTPDGTLRPAADDSAASWITNRIGSFGSGVRGLVPPVFEAYARILHPAWAADGTRVRWATVAAWSGGTAHALAEFEPMARQREQSPVPGPFHAAPTDGALEPATLAALCDVLAPYTTTPDRCSFGVWEGYGWTAWMARERRQAAKLDLPNRTFVLFEGPLDSVVDLGWRDAPLASAALQRESPNLIWPADRSWFVASEIDLDSTFVGGSTELIEELLGDIRFEAWRASPDDQVAAGTDLLNAPHIE